MMGTNAEFCLAMALIRIGDVIFLNGVTEISDVVFLNGVKCCLLPSSHVMASVFSFGNRVIR